MHDPSTVAFSIKIPLWMKTTKWKNKEGTEHSHRSRKYLYVATIWHIDPEVGGSDDSCGWSSPRLTKEQMSDLEHMAWSEARSPFYMAEYEKELKDPVKATYLLKAGLFAVSSMIKVKISRKKAERLAFNFATNQEDHFRSSLCFVPGWHSNFEEERIEDRECCAATLFCSLARIVLREARPWYRHPKWHIHHWQIRINLADWIRGKLKIPGPKPGYMPSIEA